MRIGESGKARVLKDVIMSLGGGKSLRIGRD